MQNILNYLIIVSGLAGSDGYRLAGFPQIVLDGSTTMNVRTLPSTQLDVSSLCSRVFFQLSVVSSDQAVSEHIFHL